MKKSSLVILLVLIIHCNLEAVEPSNIGGGTKFSAKLRGGNNDFPNDVIVAKTGPNVVVGQTRSIGAERNSSVITRCNLKCKEGRNFIWEKYVDYISASFIDFESTKEGGCILAAPQWENRYFILQT